MENTVVILLFWGEINEFSGKLTKNKNDKKLSQEKLAELMNVSRQAVAKWEGGGSLS